MVSASRPHRQDPHRERCGMGRASARTCGAQFHGSGDVVTAAYAAHERRVARGPVPDDWVFDG